MTLKIKKLRPNIELPVYAHGPYEDAGFDLRAVEPVIIKPLVPTLVKTGLSIELPAGYEAQIRSRSGLALKQGLFVLNAPGTVDPSYRGEIGVILLWTGFMGTKCSACEGPAGCICGKNYKVAAPGLGGELIVNEGDRIAQMVIAKYEPVHYFLAVSELDDSARGDDGFGSSGVQ